MGIIEVIFSIKKYVNMINYLVNKILFNNYDLIITIDSPDFNYPLAKKLKKKSDIKLIHIVAPSVWAWRTYRAKKFSKVFDELLVLYNFETKYFLKYGLKKIYVFTRYPMLGEPLREDGKYNTGMMVYAWYIFENGYYNNPIIDWIDNNDDVLSKKDT